MQKFKVLWSASWLALVLASLISLLWVSQSSATSLQEVHRVPMILICLAPVAFIGFFCFSDHAELGRVLGDWVRRPRPYYPPLPWGRTILGLSIGALLLTIGFVWQTSTGAHLIVFGTLFIFLSVMFFLQALRERFQLMHKQRHKADDLKLPWPGVQ
jgi:hypothetical protein